MAIWYQINSYEIVICSVHKTINFPVCSGYSGVLCLLGAWFCISGCTTRPENSVVLYTSADREYAAPILDAFDRNHPGVEIARQFDVEASKTLGLLTRIEQEQARTRCDVFWNNEIIHTIRLQQKGLLAKRSWQIPSNWPKQMRAGDGTWVGYAGRARVLLVNKERLPDASEWPKSVFELADPKWHHRCGMAYPVYGTTATHMATLRSNVKGFAMTEAWAKSFTDESSRVNWDSWLDIAAKNTVVLAGNKQTAQAVSRGELDWALTDTDDAMIEKDSGNPVELIFPDQAEGQFGTLLIPNTIGVLRDAPHPAAAALLADYLMSEKVEARLTMGNGAQFPVWPNSSEKSRLTQGKTIRWADVDFELVAKDWDSTLDRIKRAFDTDKKQ